ncbi:ABC transporter substrate-binding protein [Dermatobacter hominis]|uniref:ABC transporter substrate-binding protein n=1 Tax=Dermatobacter hominis TaxID=2884263 RepID=UPI001D112A4A|nr:ABC transporter substrate-binding protein [Dermatobacter hominis]UDY37947.1 ABC transporter substrate-binding protein [Dermatobacter hominis]
MTGGARPIVAAVSLIVTAALVAVGCSEDRTASSTTVSAPPITCDAQHLLDCARASTIADLVPDEPTAATGEPITIGMINQENTPAGSFPELSRAAQAFVDFVNEDLGGIDGRPLRLDVCNTGFSAEGSTACGQRFVAEQVPVVLGGIDVFGNAVDVLAADGIPYVGGIPVSQQSMTSPSSFQWSGGTWGAAVAFAHRAVEDLDAKEVAIVYGDFGSIAEGAGAAKQVLEAKGVDVQMVPFPVIATDLGSPLQAAWAGEPDAIFVIAADTACKAAFDAAATIGITSALYFVGACASPTIISQVGDRADGAYFNVEQEVQPDQPQPDTDLYTSVLAAMAPGLDPVGAGTVSARSFVNLYAVLRELGADGITPHAVTDALRAKADEPSFMGHAYTCDGRQFPGLPAACSPQQVVVQMHDGALEQVGGWIDVGAELEASR